MAAPSLRTRTAYGEEVSILCGPTVAKPSTQRTQSTSPTLVARMEHLFFTPSRNDSDPAGKFESDLGWEMPAVDTPSSRASSSPENGFSSAEPLTPLSSVSSTRSSSFSKVAAEQYHSNDLNLRRLAYVPPPAELQHRRLFHSKRTQSLPVVPQKRSSTTDLPEPLDRSPGYRHHSQANLYSDQQYNNASFPKEPLPSIQNLFQIAGADQPSHPNAHPQPTEFLSRRSSGIDPLDMDSGCLVVPSTRKTDLLIRPIKEERLGHPHPLVILTDADAYRGVEGSQSDTSSRSPSPTKRRRSEKDLKAASDEAPGGGAGGSATQNRPTNKRKFPCQTCGKFFTTSGHLSRHGRTHTGERKYECPHESCDARFSRQDNCMQHFRTHSNNDSRRKKRRPAASSAVSSDGTPKSAASNNLDGSDLLAALANVAALADRGGLPE